jgi:hypothetical protein
MQEMTFILDELSGGLAVESPDRLTLPVLEQVAGRAGTAQDFGCARPIEILPPPVEAQGKRAATESVRIAGLYHNSLVEGPGRRSSVLFQYCPLACKGCWVPQLHSPQGGAMVPVERWSR